MESASLHESDMKEEDYEWEKKELEKQKLIPVGGRLERFWKAWRAIGASKKIARWMNRGYRLPFVPGGESEARQLLRETCPDFLIPSYPAQSEKGKALRDMMKTLLEKDVIEVVKKGETCFFNVVFLRPKPNGTWRLILDVSKLNKFLRVKKFAMETAQKIREAVVPGMWATSIDLSDAYHHLPIHVNYRCFLGFSVGETQYRYKACPFGLSPIPQVFTEMCTPLKVFAREKWGCVVFQYIDDWLFLSLDRERVAQATRLFVRLCLQLGLIVNLEKSQLMTTQSLVHLGVQWEFDTARVRVSDKKGEELKEISTRVLAHKRSPLPLLESLLGKMISVEKCIKNGRLHYRGFQRCVMTEVKKGRSFRWVALSDEARDSLKWWCDSSNLVAGVPVMRLKETVTVHTDASLTGWGVSCDEWRMSGVWSEDEQKLHINVLEMIAVEIALRNNVNFFTGQRVCFMIDNLSVVYYVNKQGGTRSPQLLKIAERVLLFAESIGCEIFAVHVKGELNVLADMLSRREIVLKNEWRLGVEAFEWLCEMSPWGKPTIDLFANKLNHQLSRYVSPCRDSAAVAIDALNCVWPEEVSYAFPPTTILDRVLVKILREKPRALVLVAPWWPTTAWFPTLLSLALVVRVFPESILSLTQPHFVHTFQNPQQLSLAAWYISCRD